MDRRVSVGVGAAVVAIALMIVMRANAPKATAAAQTSTGLASSASAFDASTVTTLTIATSDAAVAMAELPEFPPGTRMPDGSPVPPLPEKTPRSVRFGVVLVTYRGAQGAPTGPGARSRSEALEMARKLATDAKTDFQAAVVRGDSGSVKDVGKVPRGVLEPAPEYVLFTMPTGSVSEPIDTPRGFWIVKRTE